MDPLIFRQVIGNFASGVTIITTREQDTDYGLTASAVTSLTLEPWGLPGTQQMQFPIRSRYHQRLSVHHSAPWARPEGYRVADAVIKANNATLFLVPSCRKESRSYLYINVPIVCIFLLVRNYLADLDVTSCYRKRSGPLTGPLLPTL